MAPALRSLAVLLLALALGPGAARAVAQDPVPPDAPVPPAAPANDLRANAIGIPSLPADERGTTLGATRESSEPATNCGCDAHTLWYRYVASTDGRVVATLTATDPLDAVVDAYGQQRSQVRLLDEDQTDMDGKADIAFPVKAGTSYLLKVASRAGSEDSSFLLHVSAAAPPAKAPGTKLGGAGVTETLDRVLKPTAYHNVTLREGHTYRFNIAPITPPKAARAPTSGDDSGDEDSGGDEDQECRVRLSITGPGDTRLRRTGCDAYFLFTPARGQGGRYVLETDVSPGARGGQRYHLEVAGAGPTDTAPGVALGNHAPVSRPIDGGGINRVDLYRFAITKESQLTLKLGGPAGDGMDLTLRDDTGHELDEGSDIDRRISPGRYFVTAEASADTSGSYTLTRSSRTITKTGVSFGGVARARARLGADVGVGVHVSPATGGPVRITLERLDPVAGWQYLRTVTTRVSGGKARVGFVPPSVGRFRAQVDFLGTRDAAPSSSGYATVLVVSGDGD